MPRPADEWMDRGACAPGKTHMGKAVNPDWWFPASPAGGAMGKWICRAFCPVLEECNLYAEANELGGVWGGLTEEERYGHEVTHKPRGSTAQGRE